MIVQMKLEGDKALIAKIKRMTGPELARIVKPALVESTRPLLDQAKDMVPVRTSRLQNAITTKYYATSKRTYFASMVGIRRDYTYTNKVTKQKLATGRGKKIDRALARGHKQDQGSPNFYARIIHMGTDKSGRVRRNAGPVPFLNRPFMAGQSSMVSTFSTAIKQHVERETT